MTDIATLLPRDRVMFDGKEWEVFLSMRVQTPDSPVVIWRSEGLEAPTLTRLRRELTLIPRDPEEDAP